MFALKQMSEIRLTFQVLMACFSGPQSGSPNGGLVWGVYGIL